MVGQKQRFGDDNASNGSTEDDKNDFITAFNTKLLATGLPIAPASYVDEVGAYTARWNSLFDALLGELNQMTGVGTTPTIEDEYNITTIRDINEQLLNQIADLGGWQALVKDVEDIGDDFVYAALNTSGPMQSYEPHLLALGTQQKATHLLDGGFNSQYLAQQPTVGKKQDGVEIA
jgi:hypothetical protein